MMNETEHLLVVLAEEAGEVIQEVCKALRFGLDDVKPGDEGQGDNKRRLERELAQLLTVSDLLGLRIREEDKVAKRDKLAKFMEYARSRGTLEKSAGCIRSTSSPEEWADWFKLDERFEKTLAEKAELQDIVVGLLEDDGLHHESGCPEDDTCACVFVKRVNAAMKGYGEEKGPVTNDA